MILPIKKDSVPVKGRSKLLEILYTTKNTIIVLLLVVLFLILVIFKRIPYLY
jgi:hypothetical protein